MDERRNERLYFVAADGNGYASTFGRVSGTGMSAQRDFFGGWKVYDDDGTVYEFIEGTTSSSKLHPWGTVTLPPDLEDDAALQLQKHARLRTIFPNGVSGYRIRLWHEQDAISDSANAPPGSCTGVDGGTELNECMAPRGLLVSVAAEWLDGTNWRRGSSIELKYIVPSPQDTKDQFFLAALREGADRDEGSTSPTILAEYTNNKGSDVPWRLSLAGVSSCADRTDSAGSDLSGNTCETDAASRLVAYVGDVGIAEHLVEKVRRPVRSSSGALTLADEEDFLWVPQAGTVFEVSTQTWSNGEALKLDRRIDASFEVTDMAYGPRGDLNQYSLSGATMTVERDDRMLRWRRKSGTTVDNRYRYGPGGELIERLAIIDDAAFGEVLDNNRDEYVYLGNTPVGVTHTDSTRPSPVTWWLAPDFQGVPRRVIERVGGSTQRIPSRLLMDAWGKAVQTDDRAAVGWTNVSLLVLPFRHAGQIEDTGCPGARSSAAPRARSAAAPCAASGVCAARRATV